MYEIVEKIAYKRTTETNDNFVKLLEIYNNKTNVWTAVHLLERMPTDKTIEEKALKIIKKQAEGDSADTIGFKIWLDNYSRK